LKKPVEDQLLRKRELSIPHHQINPYISLLLAPIVGILKIFTQLTVALALKFDYYSQRGNQLRLNFKVMAGPTRFELSLKTIYGTERKRLISIIY